jgi:hypothetical protein
MDLETRLELILRQLHEVQAQLLLQVQRCESTWGTAAILRSLRLSLRALTSGVDPDEAPASFVLFAGRNGEAFLRRDTHMALLSGTYLRDLLARAGVALVPGQELLLEPGLARRAIEESLGCIASESRAVEEKRADARTALNHSSGTRRTELLLALERVLAEETELHNRKVELAELYDAARDSRAARQRYIA